MKAIEYYLKKFRHKSVGRSSLPAATGTSALAITACGDGSGKSDTQLKGFPKSYVPPTPNFFSPTERDPNFEILKSIYSDPYWITSLEMDNPDDHITPMLEDFDRIISFTFQETPPSYDTYGLTGWEPATDEIKTATREFLSELQYILDVSFIETSDPKATNVIAVGVSRQATTAGFSYYPNNFFEIGMDVFIANDYANPRFVSEFLTNYDYEVLVHEIGHALGLKHPFEANGANNATLSSYEDNTRNTAMSYTENPVTFSGTLRSLDWMTLTKFYGLKTTYNAGDDTYEFSSSGGTFIMDGAGLDTISANDAMQDVMIDLRPGAHSHLGVKSNYITAANQLTISHGSDIENVITGLGNDTVIGTDSDNVIRTGSGSDTIFAGGGTDTIDSGIGADRIDLSESVKSQDTVILNAPSGSGLDVDTIYGFSQGASGDILDVSVLFNASLEIYPLVAFGSAPTANFSQGILKVTGSKTATATDLLNAFKSGGGFETLSIDTGMSALIISSDSQLTGEDQRIFLADQSIEEISVTQLAILKGNSLDIDQWHADNFSLIA